MAEQRIESTDSDSDADADVEFDDDVAFYFSNSDPSDDMLPEEILQQKSFDFLSSIKSKFVAQTSVDHIVKGMDGLLVHYNKVLEAKLLSHQHENLISVSDVKAVFESMKGQSIFEGIKTGKNQKSFRKYHRTTLEPIPIHTASTNIKVTDKGGFKEVPDVQGCASPFLQLLEVLLQCKDILHCIQNPLKSTDGKIRYLADGFMWQSHPVLIEDPHAIVIVGYGDDLQPGDGLSSKSSDHMLRSFTWTIGNIYPWLHSTLKCINILSILEKRKMDLGNGPALKDFIEGINKLSSTGVVFNIRGQPTKFRGCLLFVCGDTPASGNFSGMKESPAAFCPCRLCLVTKNTIFNNFTEDGSLLRNAELHESHLEALSSQACGNDSYAMDEDVDFEEEIIDDSTSSMDPSVKFGVNSRSCFLEVKHFDVTKCFPLDIMHIFAENGVLEVNVRLLLKSAVSKNQIALNEINSFISSFDYGPMKKNKPGKIKAEHLKNNLRQTASQMFLLAHLVPFMLYGRCDSAELKNFIRLLMIENISLAPVADDEDVGTLRTLIEEYLHQFRILYGDIMTLKFHFLVHLPTQLLMFGVLTLQWCMRFEGFHAILKRLYKMMHNAVNIPVSLVERVLDRLLHEVETCPPGQFLYRGHSGKMGPAIPLKCLEWEGHLKTALPQLQDDHELTPVENLQYYGLEFKVNSIVLIDMNTPHLPKFGTILKVFLFGETPILVCSCLETVGFDVKLNAYEVKCVQGKSLTTAMCMSETQFIQPLLGIQLQGRCYIPLMYSSKVRHSALTNWTFKDSSQSHKRARK